VPPELIRALEMAEAALSDIGDADRERGDDIAWAERRAAQDLPRIRHALQTWRDHATPPAATREAGPLPQAVVEISDEELTLTYACAVAAAVDGKRGPFNKDEAEAAQLAGLRAVLARWGGAAVPVAAADGRDPVCVAQWPDCRDGAYDPRCCRFPKSCSCGPLQQPAAAGEVQP
jgi:hypothetical protein